MHLLSILHPETKFFNTFFYTSLRYKKDFRYDRVRRWTRHNPLGVYSYKKVVFPINKTNTHWFVPCNELITFPNAFVYVYRTLVAADLLSGDLHYFDSISNRSTFSATVLNDVER
jgi:Ulp1 family protease